MKDVVINYPSFSGDNVSVWNETLNQRARFFQKYANHIHPAYLDGYSKLHFEHHNIPTQEKLNKVLKAIGWRVVFVNGYLSAKAYANLLLNKISPINVQVRTKEQIEYAPGPDLIHDIIGHLPMLFLSSYTRYLLALARLLLHAKPNSTDLRLHAAQDKLSRLVYQAPENTAAIIQIENEITLLETNILNNPSIYYQLSRIFLWTIEFGTMEKDGIAQIYGAGLMSSILEAEAICLNKIKSIKFSLDLITKQFKFSRMQDTVFVAKDFMQLEQFLAVYE